jgi:hypothetical protein
MMATVLSLVVSLGLLVGCHSAASAAAAVDRTPAGFSSLLPPPGRAKWPQPTGVSRGARLAARMEPGLVQFAIDSLVAYYDRPNPAALNYADALSYGATGKKVLLQDKVILETRARWDAVIRARFALSTVRGSLQGLQSNDDRLRRRQPAYLSLGGGLSRVTVTDVVKGADEDFVGLVADAWTSDVGIDGDGVVGTPTIRASTLSYDMFVTSRPGRLLVKDFRPQMSDPSVTTSGASVGSYNSSLVGSPSRRCWARWHRVARARRLSCRWRP